MSPAEAGAMRDEPDWKQRFEELKRDRELPPHLAQDAAFEDVLKEWRRFHFTWGTKAKKDGSLERIPANAVDGIIRLAQLDIMPPRWLDADVPRDNTMYCPQADANMWFRLRGEFWRIVGIEDRTLVLRHLDDREYTINLTTAKWDKYIEAASAALT